MRRWRIVAGTMAVAVLGAPMACGSDDVRADGDAPTTTLSIEEWATAMDRACVELDGQFDALGAAALETVEDAVEHADDVQDYASKLETAASRLADTSVDRSPVTDVESAAIELSEAASELARATRHRDPDAAAEAVEEIEAAGDAINELAAELSLDGCDGF